MGGDLNARIGVLEGIWAEESEIFSRNSKHRELNREDKTVLILIEEEV